jgi:hypothetical protein
MEEGRERRRKDEEGKDKRDPRWEGVRSFGDNRTHPREGVEYLYIPIDILLKAQGAKATRPEGNRV